MLVLTVAASAVDPTLPLTYIDTTYVAPTGATIAVAAGGNLQAAINAAVPGDVITLQQGATFTGNFTLPVKSGSGWITIRTSAADGVLPNPGTRVGPVDAGAMAKLVTNADLPAIRTSGAAHHYRLVGLEITMTFPSSYGLITFGEGTETSTAALPNNLIIDRCWVHGSATGNVQNGLRINSATSAIIDSHFDQCQSTTVESHCIAGVNGSGPFKIVNNFLGGSTIQVLFGGAVPSISGLIPSDIEFRRNLCQKPTSWRLGSADYAGTQWYVKNLFELKNARRVLIDGNIFEQNWPFNGSGPDGSAQQGYALLFTVRDEGGVASWATVQDVTVTNNIIRKSNAGIAFYGLEGAGSRRMKIQNNLFDDIGLNWGSNDRTGMFAQINRVSDLTINHNTIIHDSDITFATTGASPVQSGGFVFTNNIANHACARPINANTGINGAGTNPGLPTLTAYFNGSPAYVCTKNALAQPSGTPSYPTGNFFPSSWSAVGFTNFAARNYRLLTTSPYYLAGTDGKDFGCDFDALDAAITGNTADTIAPTITSVSASSITTSSATISWTTNEASDSRVDYGTTTGYGSSTTLAAAMVTAHAQGLSGLSASTLYHYRVRSSDAAGNLAISGDFTFTTATPADITAPIISSVSANPGVTTATITWTTDEAADSQVDYGISTAYGTSTATNATLVTAHSQSLSGLTASTLYHYRVRSRDAAGNVITSGDFTFTTSATPDTTAPVISAVTATAITSTGATITWTTDEASDTQVQYGTTTAYGSSTTLNTTKVTAHSQVLTGLTAGTLYHYRVKSADAAGNLATSGDFTFTTSAAPDTTAPVISAVTATAITSTGATITWTTDEASDTQVQYGTTTAY
ncbi:MAG: fibronectin type III domain-containing protein, partial [Planctomycetes bacterium]|nr:fibronectin type III domain-containing protein [Planctomycetota bacterium]